MNNKLRDLIEDYSPLRMELDENISLYHDLNIYGDDADELLDKYSKQFNISLLNFNFADYFPFEGDSILPMLIRLLTGKKKKEYKRLTLKMLDEAIEKRELKL